MRLYGLGKYTLRGGECEGSGIIEIVGRNGNRDAAKRKISLEEENQKDGCRVNYRLCFFAGNYRCGGHLGCL